MTPDITDLAVGGIRTLRELTQRIPFGGGILADSLHNAVKGKTIMVTGASSGIGEAACLQIGAAGGKLLLVARTKDKLDAVAEAVQDVGGTAFVHTCDLSDSGDVERMAREVLARLPAITVPVLLVRGMDCLDGTPLLDLKPDRALFTPVAPPQAGDFQVGDP